jgi:hypothetical protein
MWNYSKICSMATKTQILLASKIDQLKVVVTSSSFKKLNGKAPYLSDLLSYFEKDLIDDLKKKTKLKSFSLPIMLQEFTYKINVKIS